MKSSDSKTMVVDLPTLTLKQAEKLLNTYIRLGKSVFLHGPVGVGKSDLIRSIGLASGRKVVDIRLSQMDSTDLRGIPFCPVGSESMKWAPPTMFPTDPADDSIIFFDELNCASPSIQATAYQLILDRRVGEYKLPEKCSIIAAGNRDSDRGATFKMPSPLLNRFCHIEVGYNFECWFDWAHPNGIHTLILSYLKQNKADFITDLGSSPRAFATPRSWKAVSDVLYDNIFISGEGRLNCTRDNLTTLRHTIAGCIGMPLATKVVGWLEKSLSYPDLEQVLRGSLLEMDKNSLQEHPLLRGFAEEIALQLSKEIEPIKDSKSLSDWSPFRIRVDNAFSFVERSAKGNRETVMVFINLLAKQFKIPMNPNQLPSYKAWALAHEKYILEAACLIVDSSKEALSKRK